MNPQHLAVNLVQRTADRIGRALYDGLESDTVRLEIRLTPEGGQVAVSRSSRPGSQQVERALGGDSSREEG